MPARRRLGESELFAPPRGFLVAAEPADRTTSPAGQEPVFESRVARGTAHIASPWRRFARLRAGVACGLLLAVLASGVAVGRDAGASGARAGAGTSVIKVAAHPGRDGMLTLSVRARGFRVCEARLVAVRAHRVAGPFRRAMSHPGVVFALRIPQAFPADAQAEVACARTARTVRFHTDPTWTRKLSPSRVASRRLQKPAPATPALSVPVPSDDVPALAPAPPTGAPAPPPVSLPPTPALIDLLRASASHVVPPPVPPAPPPPATPVPEPAPGGSVLSFGHPWSESVGSREASVAIADVTGDGRNDVLLSTSHATSFTSDPADDFKLFVFDQHPDGTFGAPSRLPTDGYDAGTPMLMGVAAGDLTGDGRADVAVATPAGVDVYEQTSHGLGPPRLIPGTRYAQQALIGDFTGDGRADLAISVIEPRSFPPQGELLLATNTGHGFVVSRVAGGPELQHIAVGDLTGDGRADVVGFSLQFKDFNLPTPVTVFEQRPGGGFDARHYAVGTSYFPTAVSVGDLTGDGLEDLVFVEGMGEDLLVVPQTANHRLGTARPYWVTEDPGAIQVADFDGDGRADVVGAFLGGPADVLGPSVGGPAPMGPAVGVLRQDQGGGLYPEAAYPIPTSLDQLQPTGLAVGDLNGDGKQDIAVAEEDEALFVFYQGTGGLPAPHTTILDAPPAVTEDPTAVVSFTSDRPGSTFQCSFNAPGWRACASPVVYANTCCGDNYFSVRAVAPGGVTETAHPDRAWVTQSPAP